jgi:hypothetical protein
MSISPNLIVKNSVLSASHFPLTLAQQSTRILADVAAASGTYTVRNITGLAINQCLLTGSFGDETAEVNKTHTATAPTGSTVTLLANTVYAHAVDCPVTVLPYDQVEFSRATTVAGTKTVLATSNILADKTATGYNDLTNSTGYAFARFKNSITGTFSEYSSAVPYTGNPSNSVEKIVMKAVKDCASVLNDEYCLEQDLIDDCQEAQDEVSSMRDWSFELHKDLSSIVTVQGETEYDLSDLSMKYENEQQSLLSVRFGNDPLNAVSYSQIEDAQRWSKSDTLYADATVAATSITLVNSDSFEDDGTVYLRENGFVAYTANDKTTNVLSGIDADAITTLVPAAATVWSDMAVGKPNYCAVIDGSLLLDVPPDEEHSGFNLKFRFLRKLPTLTSFGSTTLIPFPDVLSYFVAANIEKRKRNYDEHDRLKAYFTAQVNQYANRYKIQLKRAQQYYVFASTARYDDFDNVWWTS